MLSQRPTAQWQHRRWAVCCSTARCMLLFATVVVAAGGFSCAQRRSYGNCDAAWMREGNWCAASCGYCTPPGASGPAKVGSPNSSVSFTRACMAS